MDKVWKLLIVVSIYLMLVSAASATTITNTDVPVTIDQTNSSTVYYLSGNLNVQGVAITIVNTTNVVIDGQGYDINATQPAPEIIEIENSSNVVIKNLIISNASNAAIFVNSSLNIRFYNVTITYSHTGIDAVSSFIFVSNSTIENTHTALSFRDVVATITWNWIKNSNTGIQINSSSTNSSYVNITYNAFEYNMIQAFADLNTTTVVKNNYWNPNGSVYFYNVTDVSPLSYNPLLQSTSTKTTTPTTNVTTVITIPVPTPTPTPTATPTTVPYNSTNITPTTATSNITYPQTVFYNVSGYVLNITGNARVYVLAYDANSYSVLPNPITDFPNYNITANSNGSYTVQVMPGTYYFVAYEDLNGSGTYNSNEPIGFYNTSGQNYSVVSVSSNLTGINITLRSYNTYFGSNQTMPTILPNQTISNQTIFNQTIPNQTVSNQTVSTQQTGGETTGAGWCYPTPGCQNGSNSFTVVLYNLPSKTYNPNTVIVRNFDPLTGHGYSYIEGAARIGSNYTATFTNVQSGTYILEYENISLRVPLELIPNLKVPTSQNTIYVNLSSLNLPKYKVVYIRLKYNNVTIAPRTYVNAYNYTANYVYDAFTNSSGYIKLLAYENLTKVTLEVYLSNGTMKTSVSLTSSTLSVDLAKTPSVKGYVYKGNTPVSNAAVVVILGPFDFQFGMTNSNGYFKIPVPSNGTYKVRVDPGLSGMSFLPKIVEISTNETATIHVGINNSVTIRGYAVYSNGLPVPNALVYIYTTNGTFFIQNVTSPNGDFAFEVYPNTTYKLVIDPTVPLPENNFNPPGGVMVEKKITIGTQDKTVTVTISPGYKVYGYIIKDNSVYTSNQPVGWVVVYNLSSYGWYTSMANSSGYYELRVPNTGTYKLEFYPFVPDLTNVREKITVNGDTKHNITVAAGYKLTGKVTSSGVPVSDANIYLYHNNEFVSWTMTDANGKFQILGLQNGTYRIDIYSPKSGYYTGNVTIAGDTDITVDIAGGYTLKGTVNPAHADVYIYNDRRAFWTTTTNGSFTIKGVPAGTYKAYVYYYDLGMGKDFSQPIVVSGDITNLSFNAGITSSNLVTVYGYVKDSSGSPIPNANVNLQSEVAGNSTVTDSSGYYSLVVPQGNYTMTVWASGYALNVTNVSITGGLLNVTLQSLSSVTNGTVNVTITSAYSQNVTVWLTVKSVNVTSLNYWHIYTINLNPSQSYTKTLTLPVGSYKIAVVYPIYSGGMMTGTNETYSIVDVPYNGSLTFTVPG